MFLANLEIINKKESNFINLQVKAQNKHGETTNFGRLHVNPLPLGKKSEAPNFHPSLTNQVVREGEPALIQVRITGNPTPQIGLNYKISLNINNKF